MSDVARYDDRVDVDTELTLTQTLALIGRSLGLVVKVRKLFEYIVHHRILWSEHNAWKTAFVSEWIGLTPVRPTPVL